MRVEIHITVYLAIFLIVYGKYEPNRSNLNSCTFNLKIRKIKSCIYYQILNNIWYIYVIKKKIYISKYADNILQITQHRILSSIRVEKENSTNSADPSLPKQPTPLSRISSGHEKFMREMTFVHRVFARTIMLYHLIRRILIPQYNILRLMIIPKIHKKTTTLE